MQDAFNWHLQIRPKNIRRDSRNKALLKEGCWKSQTIDLPHSSSWCVSCYSISHFNLEALVRMYISSQFLPFHCLCGVLRSQGKRTYNKHQGGAREANCGKMPNHTETVWEWRDSISLWPLEFRQLAAHWSPFIEAPAELRPVAFKPQRVDERLSWREISVNRITETGGITLSTQMHPSSVVHHLTMLFK